MLIDKTEIERVKRANDLVDRQRGSDLTLLRFGTATGISTNQA